MKKAKKRLQHMVLKLKGRISLFILKNRIGVKYHFFEDSIIISVIILVFCLLFVYIFLKLAPNLKVGYWDGVFVEFTGMMFDIIVFGILIQFYHRYKVKFDLINRQQEIIEDYKKWDSVEARFRIAGAIRRLNYKGKTDIDFCGITLSDFIFESHGIYNIDGSIFTSYYGLNDKFNSMTSLIKVDFSNILCRIVRFGHDMRSNVTLVDCRFNNTILIGSNFNNVYLEYKNIQVVEDRENWNPNVGALSPLPIYKPVFDGADLNNVSFVRTSFKNVDFRGAKNIKNANFQDCYGLETCFFDDDSRVVNF